jgi:hypothetical protein
VICAGGGGKRRAGQNNDRAGSGRPDLLLVCAGSGRNSNGTGRVITDRQPLELFFGKIPKSLVALEVGSHSPWISRLLGRVMKWWWRMRGG